ncbi:NUDIX domain-containing protein [Geothrix sp. 21YS21S-4]|uniref:NUDIX domain-containing protein n=1 Tax=Geothrix sp. 21YS21S-4 TaxID=3068889 RepID=UPI0027B954C2|nr:NUDIX domain-containing protein [Geothrix sp. 21YS21S-4]
MSIHPRPGEYGQPVTIKHPHTPTPLATWSDPTAVATAVPDGPMPPMINEVPLIPLGDPLPGRADWEERAQEMDFEEPPFDGEGSKPAAGAVVVEPDGRLWLVSPTNEYGHCKTTFPKGKAHGMSLKATALKEVFEEAGLQVELFDHLVDVTKTTSRTRYYLARRKGGSPASMCWEMQSVHLVPLEKAKEMLNQPVDHQIIDTLIEHWPSWAGWFFRRNGEAPAWEAAKSGRTPASRKDWLTLPLPTRRARIPLDIRLDASESNNLKLGLVPQRMEQKWFAYFEGDILHEHRSWTGFCISEIHFQPDGDGLRATYADVNRQTGRYECTDDAEDARLLTERIRQLAHITEEDRNAEDSFVAGLKASLVPNYLGDPKVVGRLVESYLQAVLDQHVASNQGGDVQAAHAAFMDQNKALARIFAGDDSTYQTIGIWNTAGSLGTLAIKALDLDPAYYADENLLCILSEGLAGVAICLREMTTAFEADPQAEFKRDFLPQIQRLAQFTASVLMGTQAVLFPELSLRAFTYVQAIPKPKVPGLFDTPIDIDNTQEEEEEKGQADEDMTPDEIDELRIAFDLAPLNGKPTHGGGGSSEPTLNKMGRPITLPGPIGALAKKVGGVGALADELGISPRTVRRWATDGVIPKMGLKVLKHPFEQHAVDLEGLVDTSVKE